MRRNAAALVGCLAVMVAGAGCGASAGEADDAGVVAAAGQRLAVQCVAGTMPSSAGSVILLSGLGGGGRDAFAGLLDQPATPSPSGGPVCVVDRPGVGDSPPRNGDDNSPVANADEVVAALAAAAVPPPYVYVGWSYGGLVALLAAGDSASRTPSQLAGLVLIDPVLPEEYRTLDTEGWKEGGRALDMAAGEQAAAQVELGRAPVLVIIAGDSEQNSDNWPFVVRRQREVAQSSLDYLVLSHADAGHDITSDDPEAVRAAIDAVVSAAPADVELPDCDHVPEALTSVTECLAAD